VHTPGTVRTWHWIAQQLQSLRARENLQLPDELPANVSPLSGSRPAHDLTHELYLQLRKQPR